MNRPLNIVIAGGTGFIGKTIVAQLAKERHNVIVLSRSATHTAHNDNVRMVAWSAGAGQSYHTEQSYHGEAWHNEIAHADIVINLAGAGIFDKRWTPKRKQELFESRIDATRALVQAMHHAPRTPALFISASAVGYYGDCGAEDVDERHEPGNDLLAEICVAWESEARKAEVMGIAVAMPRIGIVLHPSAGALERMLVPFRLFVGGALGSGAQYFPWVHRDDVVSGILFPLRQLQQGKTTLQGAYNLASPHGVTMQEFAETLGRTLHRPSFFPVPSVVLRMVVGESARYLLQGQNIQPARLLDEGFTFEFPVLRTALHDLLA